MLAAVDQHLDEGGDSGQDHRAETHLMILEALDRIVEQHDLLDRGGDGAAKLNQFLLDRAHPLVDHLRRQHRHAIRSPFWIGRAERNGPRSGGRGSPTPTFAQGRGGGDKMKVAIGISATISALLVFMAVVAVIDDGLTIGAGVTGLVGLVLVVPMWRWGDRYDWP